MTSSLFGRTPKSSFKELLKLDTTNAGLSSTLTTVVDGSGVAGPLQLSTTAIAVTGTLTLAADPTSNLQAATKQYVDNAASTVSTAKLSLAGGTLTGALTLAGDPASALQAATKQYVDNNTVKAGGTVTGDLILNADPTAALGAATKQYVDAVAQGLDPKQSVKAATTASITLSGTQTIDGVSLSVGDRVLVKNQSTGSQNGIYVVASGSWTRATDADTSAKVTPGLYTFVEEGTTNGATGWNLITHNPITLGTTALSFTQFGAAVSYTAGTNVSISGTTISVPNSNIPYDIAGAILGAPAASAVVFRFICVRAFTIPSGMTGSRATSATAATAQTVLTFAKNGSSFGTITFAASGTSGTFAAASSTSFAAGDVITLTAPSSKDTTFADCQFTVVATLS